MPSKKAAIATLSANIVSTIAGIVLIPASGLAWEFFPGYLLNTTLNWGTFNPVTWGGAFVIGCLINATLEGLVYKKWFIPEFRFKSKAFLWLLAANSLSVGVALISLWIYPMS